MSALPSDVWAMMLFSILVFFGVSIYVLVFTLWQEEQKMQILQTEDRLDTHSPKALQDLRRWIESHPQDPDADMAQTAYRECVQALEATHRHFYDWSEEEIARLEPL